MIFPEKLLEFPRQPCGHVASPNSSSCSSGWPRFGTTFPVNLNRFYIYMLPVIMGIVSKILRSFWQIYPKVYTQNTKRNLQNPSKDNKMAYESYDSHDSQFATSFPWRSPRILPEVGQLVVIVEAFAVDCGCHAFEATCHGAPGTTSTTPGIFTRKEGPKMEALTCDIHGNSAFLQKLTSSPQKVGFNQEWEFNHV
jgi:hypothetical protein